MPTKEELSDAIEQLKNQNANFDTCMKIAVYKYLLDVSERNGDVRISYHSDSEFMQIAESSNIDTILRVCDELFECVKMMNPSLYQSALMRLKS